MAEWAKDELRKIAEADDLHIAPFREDGVTYRAPKRTERSESELVATSIVRVRNSEERDRGRRERETT
jgi:hypothetical protein